MFDHSGNLNLSPQGGAYEAFHHQPPLADSGPLTLVASTAPTDGLFSTPAIPQSTGVAPCTIHRGYVEDGGWSSVIAICNGRQVSVGTQIQAQAQATSVASALPRKNLFEAYGPPGQMPQSLIDARAKMSGEPTLYVGVTLLLCVLAVFLWQRIFGPAVIDGIRH